MFFGDHVVEQRPADTALHAETMEVMGHSLNETELSREGWNETEPQDSMQLGAGHGLLDSAEVQKTDTASGVEKDVDGRKHGIVQPDSVPEWLSALSGPLGSKDHIEFKRRLLAKNRELYLFSYKPQGRV